MMRAQRHQYIKRRRKSSWKCNENSLLYQWMTPHCSVSTSNGRRWGVQGHQLQRPCYLDIQIETRTHSIACLRVRVSTHFSEGSRTGGVRKWCYFWNVAQPNNECISAILYKLMMHHTEIGTSWARTGTKKVYAFFREAEV